MNKQKSKKSDVTREEVKDLLDKEQLCLLRVKEKILQQIRVLKVLIDGKSFTQLRCSLPLYVLILVGHFEMS